LNLGDATRRDANGYDGLGGGRAHVPAAAPARRRSNLPTLLVYRNTDVVHSYVTLKPFNGAHATPEGGCCCRRILQLDRRRRALIAARGLEDAGHGLNHHGAGYRSACCVCVGVVGKREICAIALCMAIAVHPTDG
jgi:hypothetical protein